MGVISKTCMNWTDETKLHAWVFTPPADLHAYSYMNEWMLSVKALGDMQLLRGGGGGRAARRRSVNSSGACSLCFHLCIWLSKASSWVGWVHSICASELSYSSFQGRAEEVRKEESETGQPSSRASQGNAMLRSGVFWTVVWRVLACRRYTSQKRPHYAAGNSANCPLKHLYLIVKER